MQPYGSAALRLAVGAVFVAHGGKSQRREARSRAIPKILEPVRAAVRPLLDGLEPGHEFFRHLRHRTHAPTGCAPVSIQP